MHMKELPMFNYNLWMNCLHQDKSCQLFCPVINIAMSNNFKHSFYSNKARFIHTSTVTRLHSCPEKKIRVRLACILSLYRNQYFKKILRQNIQQKVLAYHSVLLGACPQPSSSRTDTILYYIKKNILKCFKTKLYQNIH